MVLLLGFAMLVFQGYGSCANAHAGAEPPHCPDDASAMHRDMTASGGQAGAPAHERAEEDRADGGDHHKTDSDTQGVDTEGWGHACGTVCHPPVVGGEAPFVPVPLPHRAARVAALQPDLAGMLAPPATPPPRVD